MRHGPWPGKLIAAASAFVVAGGGIGLASRVFSSDRPAPRRRMPAATNERSSGGCPSGWTAIEVPVPGNYGSVLAAVDAVSGEAAWAVGSFATLPAEYLESTPTGFSRGGPAPPSLTTPLILRWDGERWTKMPAPNPGVVEGSLASQEAGSTLRDVSAASPNDVWAVGGRYDGVEGGFALHWDGEHWSFVPTPTVYFVDGTFSAVVALGPGDAWAVGRGGLGGDIAPVIERWDGERWSFVPTPDLGRRNSGLDDIAALTADDIWAVGQQWDRPLALHWDGRSWTEVRVPKLRAIRLSGVAPVAPDDVWAVGTDYRHVNGSGPSPPVIVHWDGAKWSLAALPALSDQTSLSDVSAVAADDVWARGWQPGPEGDFTRPLVLHFDGSDWAEVEPPSGGDLSAGYWDAMDASPDGTVWYVGTASDVPRGRSYAARYCL